MTDSILVGTFTLKKSRKFEAFSGYAGNSWTTHVKPGSYDVIQYRRQPDTLYVLLKGTRVELFNNRIGSVSSIKRTIQVNADHTLMIDIYDVDRYPEISIQESLYPLNS